MEESAEESVASQELESGMDCEEDRRVVILMKDEMKRKKKNSKELCKMMQSTYSRRKLWITQEQPPVQEILDLYPALKHPKVVSWVTLYQWVVQELSQA